MQDYNNQYSILMNEISSNDIFEGFLGYGLIAEKVPPFLSSKSFYDWYIKNDTSKIKITGRDYIRYDSMRNTNSLRNLAIPNPFGYAKLCESISSNWETIKSKLVENCLDDNHKISRIHIRKMKDKKHLFEMNYKNFQKDGNPEQSIMIGKEYLVEADISSCFPSIYSHSVPWALSSKEKAKKDQHNKTSWLNILDRDLRNIKNQETNGLLIGPHASNLISEIILTKVDNKLSSKGYEFIRFVDDYNCYVDSYNKAEEFLLDLSKELKEYELFLNSKKTKITKLPLSSTELWVNKLNSSYLGCKKNKDGKDEIELMFLRNLLDTSIEMAKATNNSAIFNYTFQIISGKALGKRSLEYYMNYIHHLILLYPYLVTIVDKYVFEKLKIGKFKIERIANDLFKIGIEKQLYEACSYSLFWALKYNLTINEIDINKIKDSKDCIFLLLSYLYFKKNELADNMKELNLFAKELSQFEFDRYWLFVYEVLSQSDIKGEFKSIKKEKVTFLKEEFIF